MQKLQLGLQHLIVLRRPEKSTYENVSEKGVRIRSTENPPQPAAQESANRGLLIPQTTAVFGKFHPAARERLLVSEGTSLASAGDQDKMNLKPARTRHAREATVAKASEGRSRAGHRRATRLGCLGKPPQQVRNARRVPLVPDLLSARARVHRHGQRAYTVLAVVTRSDCS